MPSADKRLSNVYRNAKVTPFNARSKFIIMSDCHRGVGNTGDSYLNNQEFVFSALQHDHQNGFTDIELGDGDELWENRNMKAIIAVHSNAFRLMSLFYRDHRNDGSCVHPRCITGIEIENNALTLVKWSVMVRSDQTLYAGRQVLEGPVAIDDYIVPVKHNAARVSC